MCQPAPIILAKYGIKIIIQKIISYNKSRNPCHYYTISENGKILDRKLKRNSAITFAKKILADRISLLPEETKLANPQTAVEKRKAADLLREPKFNFGE